MNVTKSAIGTPPEIVMGWTLKIVGERWIFMEEKYEITWKLVSSNDNFLAGCNDHHMSDRSMNLKTAHRGYTSDDVTYNFW